MRCPLPILVTALGETGRVPSNRTFQTGSTTEACRHLTCHSVSAVVRR